MFFVGLFVGAVAMVFLFAITGAGIRADLESALLQSEKKSSDYLRLIEILENQKRNLNAKIYKLENGAKNEN